VVMLLATLACTLSADLNPRAQPTPQVIVVTATPNMLQSAPQPAPQSVPTEMGVNVAAGKPVVARAGGVTYSEWGNANDAVDYNTTTRSEGGRWGNSTNQGGGTFQIIDLGTVYQLTGIGYSLDWDGAFQNPLTFQVQVSTDNESWKTVSRVIHKYSTPHCSNHVDVDMTIEHVSARYVKYSEPPDGEWNGWGTLFQLRAYSANP